MTSVPVPAEANKSAIALRLSALAVQIPDPSSVRSYIGTHPDLAGLVAETCTAARQEFGPAAEISLELYRDTEISDEYLTLYVRQARYETDMIARLDRVVLPFTERLEQASGNLLLTSDFRPPRASSNAV